MIKQHIKQWWVLLYNTALLTLVSHTPCGIAICQLLTDIRRSIKQHELGLLWVCSEDVTGWRITSKKILFLKKN